MAKALQAETCGITDSDSSANPYRKPPDSVPMEDYKKAQAEIDRLTKIIERSVRNDRLAQLSKDIAFDWLPKALFFAALCYAVWFFGIRGEAIGVSARLNAEREARIFAKNRFNIDNARVYCQTGGEFGMKFCSIYADGSNTRYIQASCDTDYPVTNDGCYRVGIDNEGSRPSAQIRVVGPHGETIGYVADAGM